MFTQISSTVDFPKSFNSTFLREEVTKTSYESLIGLYLKIFQKSLGFLS